MPSEIRAYLLDSLSRAESCARGDSDGLPFTDSWAYAFGILSEAVRSVCGVNSPAS